MGKQSKIISMDDMASLFDKRLLDVDALFMMRQVIDDEIKKACMKLMEIKRRVQIASLHIFKES